MPSDARPRIILIVMLMLGGGVVPAGAQSADDVCRMGIAEVQKQRQAVEQVRARGMRALSKVKDSVKKTLGIANMALWYRENMRDLDAQLYDLQQQCDPASQVRRGEPIPRVAPVPRAPARDPLP